MVLGTGKVSFYNLFIDGVQVSCSKETNLLGITIDNQFEFKKHIEDLCKKASHKFHAIRSSRPYLTVIRQDYFQICSLIANFIMLPSYGCLRVKWQSIRPTSLNK